MEKMKRHIKEWLFYCQRSYSVTTYTMYKSTIGQFLEYISKNGNNGYKFNNQIIEDFLNMKFIKDKVSRRSWNTYLIIIRSFASWRQKKYSIKSPVHKISFIREDPPKQRVLTEMEYQLCLKNTRGMDNEIFLFVGNTGLRKSEFQNLKWKDIPIDLKYVRILGKGRKSRIVPLNSAVREILLKYKRLPDNEYIQFCRRYYGNEGISWLCRKTARQINIPRFGAHAIRHRFATEMIRRGVNLYKLSKILGHSSITTTERIYLHLAPVDLIGECDILVDVLD